MNRRVFVLMLCGAVLRAAPARAELVVGDDAPRLEQGEYLRGEPVQAFEKGKVYVVEMWATWCGPCVQAMPHVAELQQKYADKGLVVIGQDVWERDEAKVKPFVNQMGPKLTYRIAMDKRANSAAGAMAETWMEAAGQDTIPCSFIVNREGKIAWIGHPMVMDEPLADVIAGKYDLARARDQHVRHLAWWKQTKALEHLAHEGKWAEALAKLDEMEKADEKGAKEFAPVRYRALVETKQPEKAAALVEAALTSVKDDGRRAVRVADVAFELKDYGATLRLATAAAPHAEELAYYAYLLEGFVHAAQKNWDKAIEAQKNSVKAAPDGARRRMEQILQGYEQKARN
jgi:thiol-disulfide isomerase/thioredoxin